MTLQEWYHQVIDYFESKSVNVFIHGSTLLGAVRDQKLLERIPFDKEINLGIRSDDLTFELLNNMERTFPFFHAEGDLNRKVTLIYFGPEPIIKYHSQNKDMWAMEPGMALLAVFWKGKTKWIEYMGQDICLTWPRHLLDRYAGMDLADRRVTVPFNRHEWLSHYFGEDYMTEKLKWHWSTDSLNLESHEQLEKEGEFDYEEKT